MMSSKFQFAIDLRNGKRVTLAKLDKIPKGAEIFKHLGCPGCKCSLVFRHSGVKSASLATKWDVEHGEGCEYTVQHGVADQVIRYRGDATQYLTPTEQRARASESYYEYKRKYNADHGIPNKKRKSGTRKKKEPKSLKKDEDTGVVIRRKNHPTLHPEQETNVENNTSLHIPPKYPLMLSNSDIGGTFRTGGVLSDVRFFNSQATIEIKDQNVPIRLVFDEAFFNSASVSFSGLLHQLKGEVLPKVKDNLVIVSATMETIPGINGGIDCMVRSEIGILFNNKPLSVFLHKFRSAS